MEFHFYSISYSQPAYLIKNVYFKSYLQFNLKHYVLTLINKKVFQTAILSNNINVTEILIFNNKLLKLIFVENISITCLHDKH